MNSLHTAPQPLVKTLRVVDRAYPSNAAPNSYSPVYILDECRTLWGEPEQCMCNFYGCNQQQATAIKNGSITSILS